MRTIIIFTILIILVLLRFAMPYAIKNYAEYRINQIPEYRVTIDDVDVHLYRGSYTLKNIKLQKIDKKIPVPFFSAKAIDFSVDWGALMHGAFVAKIYLDQPALNFVIDPQGKNEQTSINDEWRNAVKALFPLNFNKIVVQHGSLHFQSFNSKPPFDLYLKNIDAKLDHIRDVAYKVNSELSSTLTLQAQSMDGAPVTIDMHFDPLADQPKFDLEAKIERMHVKEANSFLAHYTKITIKQGLFSMYIEAAAADGKITGYAKPLIHNLQVTEPKSDSAVESLYKGAVQLVADMLKNEKTQAVATRVEIKGDIDDPDTSLWSIITYTLSNAFLQALLPRLDHSIDMSKV